MAIQFVLGLFLIINVVVVHGGQYCTDDNDFWSGEWCDYGCCGTTSTTACCSQNVATIVGAVIGSIAGIAALVTVIVVICCCLKRGRGHQGQVIGGHTTGPTVISSTNMQMAQQGGMQYDQQPRGYVNSAYPQMQAPPPANGQQWQHPPPSYDNTNTK